MDEVLEELAKQKSISKAEVIRRAVAMYKYVDDETRNGDKRVSITSANEDRILKDIVNL